MKKRKLVNLVRDLKRRIKILEKETTELVLAANDVEKWARHTDRTISDMKVGDLPLATKPATVAGGRHNAEAHLEVVLGITDARESRYWIKSDNQWVSDIQLATRFNAFGGEDDFKLPPGLPGYSEPMFVPAFVRARSNVAVTDDPDTIEELNILEENPDLGEEDSENFYVIVNRSEGNKPVYFQEGDHDGVAWGPRKTAEVYANKDTANHWAEKVIAQEDEDADIQVELLDPFVVAAEGEGKPILFLMFAARGEDATSTWTRKVKNATRYDEDEARRTGVEPPPGYDTICVTRVSSVTKKKDK